MLDTSMYLPGDVQISTITYVPPSENRLPRCEVDEKEITIFIDHFSFGWPVLKIRNPFVRGKRLGCLSFVPKGMPPTKKPILRVHLFDNVKGNVKVYLHLFLQIIPIPFRTRIL